MTDEQRRLFRETQAVMSLLEGFSDYVMDEVGRDLVPGVERISAKFHERRHARRSPFERAVMRLTGMDVKMEQYRKGERVRLGDRRGRRGGRAATAVGRARSRCRRTARSTIPQHWLAGRDVDAASSRHSRDRDGAAAAGRSRLRAGRGADGDRPVADPLGALPVARPRADPGGRARRADRDASASRA